MNKILDKLNEISPKSILLIIGKKSYLHSVFYSELLLLKKKYNIQIWNYNKSYPDFFEIEGFLYTFNKFRSKVPSFEGNNT